jgi:hypothetical protein
MFGPAEARNPDVRNMTPRRDGCREMGKLYRHERKKWEKVLMLKKMCVILRPQIEDARGASVCRRVGKMQSDVEVALGTEQN